MMLLSMKRAMLRQGKGSIINISSAYGKVRGLLFHRACVAAAMVSESRLRSRKNQSVHYGWTMPDHGSRNIVDQSVL